MSQVAEYRGIVPDVEPLPRGDDVFPVIRVRPVPARQWLDSSGSYLPLDPLPDPAGGVPLVFGWAEIRADLRPDFALHGHEPVLHSELGREVGPAHPGNDALAVKVEPEIAKHGTWRFLRRAGENSCD